MSYQSLLPTGDSSKPDPAIITLIFSACFAFLLIAFAYGTWS